MKKKLPKIAVILLFNLCASLYVGIGVYGLLLGFGQRLTHPRPMWHTAVFGLAAILCIEGICYFGALWDGIVAWESSRPRQDPKSR